MNNYGFQLISSEEAHELGIPNGSGLFKELFANMNDEIERNKFKSRDYGQAPFMSENEKIISFLNRYFVYKKVRNVNTELVELDLHEYETAIPSTQEVSTQRTVEKEEIIQEQIIGEEIQQPVKQNKVRKLRKKLLIVPATEAVDEMPSEQVQIEIPKEDVSEIVNTEKIKKPRKPRVSNKKITIAKEVEEINIPSEEIAIIEKVEEPPILLINPTEKIKKPRKPRVSNKKIRIENE
jgi:hypothetical protein